MSSSMIGGHEYGDDNVEYSDNTSDGEPSQDANSEDGSAQNIREDTQGIEGFAIPTSVSIKTTDRLRRLLFPFGIDPNVTFECPIEMMTLAEKHLHIAFFKYGLRPTSSRVSEILQMGTSAWAINP
ncbi:hypothetical protein FNV43_RR12136 [Rhamnella rubrinervis]|uniref:Uncharacterized protein n=1 Tax=Rhamnella rubrinervis TaxID=2594499 RepID=A0A8K0H6T9_9ROSA|nr:hypothetical protein FNV43_RR12136 [Rhamnella rubrinervis]